MNTCSNCFFWNAQDPGDQAACCVVDPPRVIPIMGMEAGKPKTILQNIYPTTERETPGCRHHDSRPRPVIKITSMMPRE
jgi:hypothetical protein